MIDLSKLKYTLAVIATAFFVSCGEVPEDDNLVNNPENPRINPLKPTQLEQEEKNLLFDACVLLEEKKLNFIDAIEDSNPPTFQFRGKNEACSGSGFDFIYSATPFLPSSGLRFRVTPASASYKLSDILTNESQSLASFCAKVRNGNLNSRVENPGTTRIQQFQIQKTTNYFLLVLTTAQKLSNGKLKLFETNDYYISSDNGIVVKRLKQNYRNCNQGAAKVLVEMVR